MDVAVPVGADMLSIGGEVGWSRDTDEFQGQDINLDLLNVGGGVRFSFTGTPALAPYGQVIVGAQRNSSNFDDSSVTNLMLGFDGGVDFLTGQTWGVFGQFGYRRVDYDITGGNAIRFLVGARLRVQ